MSVIVTMKTEILLKFQVKKNLKTSLKKKSRKINCGEKKERFYKRV